MSELNTINHRPAKEFIRRFVCFFRLFLFWILFFAICRTVFLVYLISFSHKLTFIEIIKVYYYGMFMDISAAAYILILPFLIWIIQLFFTTRILTRLVKIYSFFIAIIISILTIVDLQTYKEWGAKLNTDAFLYLKHPKEAMASVGSSPVFLLIGIGIILIVLSFFLLRYVARSKYLVYIKNSLRLVFYKIILSVFLAGLIFMGMRGSFDIIPMNPSFSFFSSKQFANHASLNTAWNLMYDVKYFLRDKHMNFEYMPEKEMLLRVLTTLPKKDSNPSLSVISSKKPNIVVIILESWTAKAIEPLGGIKGLTPQFNKLCSEGLLFTNIYANGTRTPHALPAVLCGFPSTPEGPILNVPSKAEKLDYITKTLAESGYKSFFFYGGNINFDNMKALITYAAFDKTIDKSDFKKSETTSKWGAHDEVLYNRVLIELKKNSFPFFSVILTLSSHEPFEVPMQTVIQGSEPDSLFKNSLFYADKCLGDFFKKAAEEPWYDNTLFVLLADHGHHLLKEDENYFGPTRFHIPLLLYGNVLRPEFRGYRDSLVGNQSDIPATLLGQMQINHTDYVWSNDLLNNRRNPYAVYNFKNGFGWCTPQQNIVFDNYSRTIIYKTNPQASDSITNECLKNAQAYIQFLFYNHF
jgi:phosphoglycerol transferase MdoB-like AlkP superfamily enzyme